MKITTVETIQHDSFPNLVHVRIGTDDGLIGTGETFYGTDAVAAQVHAVAAPALLGHDPLRSTAHSLTLRGYVGYTGSGAETRARSAIDLALWDIRGQAAGMPVHDLIGGRVRDTVPIYNTCAGSHYVRSGGQSTTSWGLGAPSDRLEDLQRFLTDAGGLAEELLTEGIGGMKIWPFDSFAERSRGTAITTAELKVALRPIQAIREAVGDQIKVMVELHSLWTVPAANSIIAALADYQPYWIEDPVRADLVEGLAAVRQSTAAANTMIAVGETVAGLTGFVPLLASTGGGAVDVATVDLTWCGGLSEAVSIAALAAACGRMIAPHDCTGPIALTAGVHLSVAAPTAVLQETVRAAVRGWYSDIVTVLPEIVDGSIRPCLGPGLGTELQPDYLRSTGARRRQST